MGIVGAFAGVVSGALMVTGLPAAQILRATAFVLYGLMLLFLATTAKGQEKKSFRAKLLLLFFSLLISFFDLPILCPALEALVLPLFSLFYRTPQMQGRWFLMVILEALYMVMRTLAITSLFGAYTATVVGAVLIVLSLARFVMLVYVRSIVISEDD